MSTQLSPLTTIAKRKKPRWGERGLSGTQKNLEVVCCGDNALPSRSFHGPQVQHDPTQPSGRSILLRELQDGRLSHFLFEEGVNPSIRVDDVNVEATVLDKFARLFEGRGIARPLQLDAAGRVETADFKHHASSSFLEATPFSRVVFLFWGVSYRVRLGRRRPYRPGHSSRLSIPAATLRPSWPCTLSGGLPDR